MKVNIFNIWNEVDPKKVCRWMNEFAFLSFILVAPCEAILLIIRFTPYIMIPIIPPFRENIVLFAAVLTIFGAAFQFTHFGVILLGSILDQKLVYPLFSGFIWGIFAIEFVLFLLGFLLFFYASLVKRLADTGRYESFGEVRKAIRSLAQGSKRDKTMFALYWATSITYSIAWVLFMLGILMLFSLLQIWLTALPFVAFSIITSLISEMYLKRRILKEAW